jgi:DNA helicase-2/ATP-dependent DNA helicase PcrA
VLHGAADEPAEARFVAGEVARLRLAGVLGSLDEVAVLYRTNRQARELALALRARRLPYRVRGSGDFFARREIRDAVGYLRLALDPDDAAALARVVNAPPRRLGRLAELLRESPVPLGALRPVAARGGPAAVEAVAAFAGLVGELHRTARRLPPAALLDLALDRSGYRAWLGRQADGAERLGNLAALRDAAGRERDLGAWLADLQVGDHAEPEREPSGRVLLTTIHLAKGGEWPAVFLVGAEEGLLPHTRALAEPAADGTGVAEELRLAYVAVTRPCERLYLSHCRTRRQGSRTEPRRLSRFLRALPPELLRAA